LFIGNDVSFNLLHLGGTSMYTLPPNWPSRINCTIIKR